MHVPQGWLKSLFLDKCRAKSKALRERGVITWLWLLMYTEGYAMTTCVRACVRTWVNELSPWVLLPLCVSSSLLLC